MVKKENEFLLKQYFHKGWLERAYFDGERLVQPYSAEDRLRAGELLYEDFLAWKKGTRMTINYDLIKVDCSTVSDDGVRLGYNAERFRRSIRLIPKSSMAVVYKIVLDEQKINPPAEFSTREKLYFCNEIKGLLCRGLDALCSFYMRWL